MSDLISFTDHNRHHLNANGWTGGLMQLQALGVDLENREAYQALQGRIIEVDLSRATFADFTILGRILILAAALAGRGAELKVRMPSGEMFADEQELLETRERQIQKNLLYGYVSTLRQQRMNCRLFLSQSGFDSALKTGPLTDKVDILEGDEIPSVPNGSGTSGILDPNSQERHAPMRLRRILPYRWLDVSNLTNGTRLPDIYGLEQSLATMGLTSYDAVAVTQGIFREALENVAQHAGSGVSWPVQALLGASLVQPSVYSPRQQDFDEDLQSFIQRASEEVESPILRLFAGDAGRGIMAKPNHARERDAQAVKDAIIQALDYHVPSPTRTAGPHGLWKVKELVRGFQGSVVIHSGPAVAGYVFDPNERKVNRNSEFAFPGAMVECCLLAAAKSDTEPAVGGGSAFPSPTEGSPADLKCVTALLRSGMGLDPSDVVEIERTIGSAEEPGVAGVVISLEMRPGEPSPNDWDIQQAIHQIYDRARGTRGYPMVAVVFAGVSWRLLSLAVIDLVLQLDLEAHDFTSFSVPMLIMTVDGHHRWVGGSSGIRTVLYRLSNSGQAQRLTTMINLLESGEEARWVREPSSELRRILTIESGMVRLAFHPRHVISALTDHCRQRLAVAAAQQHPDHYDRRVFVAPSLREVGKWVDIRSALHTAKCTRVAGFLMAEGIRTMLPARSGSPPDVEVIRLGALEEEVASTLALALTGNELLASFEELMALSGPRADADRRLVLYADIISNGASMRRAIRELWHLGFSDVAVATIFDARDRSRIVDNKKEGPDYLLVYGNVVPLFGLTSVSVELEKITTVNRERAFVDPVICQPMPPKFPRAKTFMNQEKYKEAIKRSDAARLGHIHRSGKRHYAAYVDTARLFADAAWSRTAFRMMVERIERDRLTGSQGTAGKTSTLCVIYPGEPNEDLAFVGHRLLGTMLAAPRTRGSVNCVDPIPVPRAIVNGEWVFPRVLQFPKNVDHIVAIDSPSKTGTTLRHLIRLAAQPQIKMISAFSLVNGMTDLEALTLQEIASVRARACDDAGVWHENVVPVNVRYLVRTAAGSIDDASCPQCALREKYTLLPAMPALLEPQRDWLLHMLETRSRQSVLADALSDLYGAAITQEDCIEYLLWRSYMAEASVDTEMRLLVVEKITELADVSLATDLLDPLRLRRDAIVRVLAAEHNRLQAAPLWFTSVRAKVMKILWSMVEAPQAYAIDQALRVQAVIVLSLGDVRGFSERYARLAQDSCDNKLVLRQVLVEAVRLINGRYGLPEWSNTLADQISLLSQEVHARPGSSAPNSSRETLVAGVDYLARLIETGQET
jgi:hypothetical protein